MEGENVYPFQEEATELLSSIAKLTIAIDDVLTPENAKKDLQNRLTAETVRLLRVRKKCEHPKELSNQIISGINQCGICGEVYKHSNVLVASSAN